MHEKPILKEWEQIVLHLQHVGEKSTKSAEVTIKLFSDYLFNADNLNQTMLKDLEPAPHNNPTSFQTNQFIITLLENAEIGRASCRERSERCATAAVWQREV